MAEHKNEAVVVDTAAASRLTLQMVPMLAPRDHEAQVRVAAISLNRGEVSRALNTAANGWRPGWDFAGVVEREAANGSGPTAGTEVVGFLADGAWARFVTAPVDSLAALPDGLMLAQTATLPVAGLTALHALRQGGLLLGKKVLVTGASGEVLAAALGMLAFGGVCVAFGASASGQTTFDLPPFFRTGQARLYGLSLFAELCAIETASVGLSRLLRLLRLVAAGGLKPRISVEASWREVGAGRARADGSRLHRQGGAVS